MLPVSRLYTWASTQTIEQVTNMLGADMASKGAKIVNVGFTFKLCGKDRAIACENSPVTNHCELHVHH